VRAGQTRPADFNRRDETTRRADLDLPDPRKIKEINMASDKTKPMAELLDELNTLKNEHTDLKRRYEALTQRFDSECLQRDQTAVELSMAQVIIDESPAILFRRLAGDDPKLVYVSNNISLLGYTAEEFLNGDMLYRDIVHPDDLEKLGAEIEEHADRDVEEYTQIYRVLTKDGEVRWVEDQTSVVRDAGGNKTHNQGIVVDITARRLAEEELRKSEEKFRRIVETAGEGFILMDQNLVIIDVNEAYCRMLGYPAEEILGKTPLDFASDEFRQFMATNRDNILAREYRVIEGESISKDGRKVPVLIHGNTLRDDRGDIIGNMAFITDMTEHKKALALAAEVQKSLLPQAEPQVQGLDIAGRNISCDEIGGDYFDFLWRREYPDAYFSVIVGDITGHGVDAALLMTAARAFLRMRASQSGSISQIVTEMNRHLSQDVLDTGRFMTLFYLTLDPQADQIGWVRAGHDPAIIYDPARDTFEELKGNGIALGVDEDFTYPENHRAGLSEGLVIAVGTDGIWETCNHDGEMFGKERFREIIRRNAHAGARVILNAVYDELHQFAKGLKAEDDITLVIIKVNEK
jgi:sigma-B regulation protein RsbU (phosphoserine phosphatase)